MYDFSGYATRNDLRCGDGRIIRRNAFKDNDNTTVPLVWQHVHNNPNNVLGHADLENREDGVYAYCTFNDTESGRNAKALVQHGDITSLSIYANKLQQNGNEVLHGIIREVSLVLAGANPGASIDPATIAHSDGIGGYEYVELDDEAVIYTGEDFIIHSDEEDDDMSRSDETIQDVIDSMNEDQKNVLYFMVGQALEDGGSFSHADDDYDELKPSARNAGDKTVQDVINSMSDEQKKVMYFMVGQALNSASAQHDDMYDDYYLEHDDMYDDDYLEHDGMYYDDDYYMEDDMKFNAFDAPDGYAELSHSEIEGIIQESQNGSNGSLKNSFLEHGIENLEILYPEARLVGDNPEVISRDMTWVDKVWGGVKKTPFSRIKSIAANITEYEARARGYIKGNKKIEEVLPLLSRSTTPQTVYKLQKIDRDDVVDITTLDVVAWMKGEMRKMLNEEIVRAVMVGDDRPSTDPSYINPEHIRPIYQDNDLYTIHETVEISNTATFNDIADTIIETAVLARKNYQGSGTPTMYASTDVITRMLLAKDTLGHRMYRNESELAAALRVSSIVEVPIFDGVTRVAQVTTDNGNGSTVTTQETRKLLALIVNLADYNVGADKGGEVNLFDNFDLNFNKYEYLIETRCSGALIRPYSAIAIETTSTLPFTFGTISGMYKGSKTEREAQNETTGD